MMDVVVADLWQVPTRETLRDTSGAVIGTVELQRQTRKSVARDNRGVLVGSYDPRTNETRDSRGRVIGRANLLAALLFAGR